MIKWRIDKFYGSDKYHIISESGTLYLTKDGSIDGGTGTPASRYYYDSKELAQAAINKYNKEQSIMTDEQLYIEMSKRSGFEVGDTVRILRKFRNNELGTHVIWDKDMEQHVGKQCSIENIDSYVNYRMFGWNWPFFCLELVSKKPKSVDVKLNDSYTAKVEKDTITVGCQSFPVSKLAELQKAVDSLKG